MDETNKIQDAEIEKTDDVKEEPKIEENFEELEPEKIRKNKKIDFYVELGLILILGILIGIAIKTEAEKKITIGFSDYMIKQVPEGYNINQVKAQLIEQQTQNQSQGSGIGSNQ